MNMTRGILSVKSMNYTGIRLVLLALFVMCICSCASFVQEPSTKAATIELKILSESGTKGSIAKIQEAIQAGADVNAADRWGDTPLLIASYRGYIEIVKLLLTAGADANVNPGRKIHCFTALMAASENGHTEIVKLLLTAGADVNAADKTEGVSPLLMTSLYGYTEIVKLLLTAGADVNIMISVNGIDHTPLSLSKEMSHTRIVKLLIEYGAKDGEQSSTTIPHRAGATFKAKKESSEVKPVATTMGGKKITNSLGMEFVYIKPGTFMMGSPTNESGAEKQLRVTLTKGFYMGIAEVTVGQWTAVMGNYPSYFRNCGVDCPVEQISWNDVQAFIRKLNRKEGSNKYRLPTEAEWEYAARAGSTTALASRGISGICGYDSNLDAMGWYCGNSDSRTHRVAGKKPNKWGLYDMYGNVWEWCQDWYESYPFGSVIDPTGPSSGSSRVFRGGGWASFAKDFRSALRRCNKPGSSLFFLGFRLVLSPGD